MTILNTKKLKVGSYKGVEFHYQTSVIEGGRKTVTHEYPDSRVRIVEDLGGLEKTFEIIAIVNNNTSYANRDSLLSALEEGGVGVLIHPEYGTNNVVLISYSSNDTINRLGSTSITMVFEVAQDTRFPATTKGNKGLLDRLKTGVLGSNEAVFDSLWSDVKTKKQEFDSAVKTTQNVSRELQRASASVEGVVDGISDYVTTLNELVDDATTLVQTPSALSSKLRTAFDNLEVAFDKSVTQFNVVRQLFGSDASDRNSTGNSGQQRAIANNQKQLNDFVNASAFALAYNSAANIDYQTSDEVSNVLTILEDGFSNLDVSRVTYRALLEMRIQTNIILNNIAIGLPRVITITTNKISLTKLVYSLYGSLDNKTIIKDLNQFLDTSIVEGEIKVLSNG